MTLMVTARGVRLGGSAPAVPAADLNLVLVGDTAVSYLGAGDELLQETYRARDARVAQLVIPAPLDHHVRAQFEAVSRERRRVDVYAEYRLREGRPVALETFTMVGDDVYVDLGARNVVNR